jgi:hypothetical protein
MGGVQASATVRIQAFRQGDGTELVIAVLRVGDSLMPVGISRAMRMILPMVDIASDCG